MKSDLADFLTKFQHKCGENCKRKSLSIIYSLINLHFSYYFSNTEQDKIYKFKINSNEEI